MYLNLSINYIIMACAISTKDRRSVRRPYLVGDQWRIIAAAGIGISIITKRIAFHSRKVCVCFFSLDRKRMCRIRGR